MCGGAYALKRVEQATFPQQYADDCKPCESSFPDAQPAGSTHGQPSGSTGPSYPRTKVVGLREGVWFRQWEGTIRSAVLNRLQESEPLVAGDGGPTSSSIIMQLDGY